MDIDKLKAFLDLKVEKFEQANFIADDPIQIPHSFSKKQDIEIAALFAAVLAWGLRKTIINKTKELLNRIDNSPHDFVLFHSENELKKLIGFKHRTFNDTDLLYFITFLRTVYQKNDSLECIFLTKTPQKEKNTEQFLVKFYSYFCSLPDFPLRTKKHISSPTTHSACKRLSMFLRWMVRSDEKKVDFSIWTKISPSQLICPLDVHVERIARELGLLERKQKDWRAAVELTENLKKSDKNDPVKYDFALFGIGIENKNYYEI